jgi:hypothetical protein
MEGTKETKEVIDLVIALAKGIESALEDGKIELTDALALIPAVMKAPAAFGDAAKIPAELKDLSEGEHAALVAWAKAELDLKDDKAEEQIELAISVGLQLCKLVLSLKK